MKNGYYLSVYVSVGELQAALNMKFRHDQAIGLWHKKGNCIELVHYWELERISGFKQHSCNFYTFNEARAVINELLKQYQLSLDDIVEIWGTPGIDTSDDYASVDVYPELSYHSICHLMTSIFQNSTYAKNGTIIALALDSGPDNLVQLDAYNKLYYAGAVVKNGKIKIFPIHSPGKLWSCCRRKFNLREGALMALTSASSASLLVPFDEHVDLYDEAAFNNSSTYVEQLWEHLSKVGCTSDDRFTKHENKISAFMKQIMCESQYILKKEIDIILRDYCIEPTDAYLGLSGGFSLNCPSNSYLMEHYGFKDLLVVPCPNDCGMALGIGLYAFYKKMDTFPQFNLRSAYYGDYCENINDIIISRYEHYISSINNLDYDIVIKDLTDAPVVWMSGRSEMGPRALGNRSLLGDPRSFKMKDQMNEIKLRQWWRPVAPIVLDDYGNEIFVNYRHSPYMLETLKIKDKYLELIPAVAHLDNTARIQSVTYEDNKEIYELIKNFYKKTGIPLICNTSLNDKGEPIINTVDEAINFVLRKGIKVAYFNGVRVEFKNHEDYHETQPYVRNSNLFNKKSDEEIKEIRKQLNPYDLTDEVLTFYFHSYKLMSQYSISNINDINIINEIAMKERGVIA